MAEKKREAESAVELMRATFARIRSEEETRMGLVIVKALYGPIVSVDNLSTASGARSAADDVDEEPADMEHVIDVMVPLQCLVKDSKLVLHEATKVLVAIVIVLDALH
jgi:DnaJ family protein C protein 11